MHLSGTGTPEGVITAAPGSTWLQTDSTVDVKGWIRWIKATGTGSTGWVAGAEADTGWRDVSSLLDADATTKVQTWTRIRIRRIGDRVSLLMTATLGTGTAVGTADSIRLFTTTPTGFAGLYLNESVGTVAYANRYPCVVGFGVSNSYPSVSPPTSGNWAASYFSGVVTWTTTAAWPSSLPGSAA